MHLRLQGPRRLHSTAWRHRRLRSPTHIGGCGLSHIMDSCPILVIVERDIAYVTYPLGQRGHGLPTRDNLPRVHDVGPDSPAIPPASTPLWDARSQDAALPRM